MTQRQRQLLRFIERYSSQNDGVSPTVQEMADALSLVSRGAVLRLIQALHDQGYVYRHRNRARGVVVRRDVDLAAVPEDALRAELRRRARIAKLESIESGVETFEEAFLANVVMADGSTLYERVQEPIAIEYRTGAVQSAATLFLSGQK